MESTASKNLIIPNKSEIIWPLGRKFVTLQQANDPAIGLINAFDVDGLQIDFRRPFMGMPHAVTDHLHRYLQLSGPY